MINLQTLIVFWTVLLCGYSCQTQSNTAHVEYDYSEIESNLIRPIQIKGYAYTKYDLLDRMKHYGIPGLSIAIVHDGEIRWSKAYGYRDAHNQLLLETNTLIQAASVTKPITALAILKLMEEGFLDLDQSANYYLKRWKLPDNEFTQQKEVSIRHLLTHTSGLNSHGFDGYHRDELMPTPIEVLDGSNDDGPVEVEQIPGSKWRYSGGGYIILQLIIEDVTGMSFEEYMNEEILTPLKMTNSIYQMPLDTIRYQNVSSGHYADGTVLSGKWRNLSETGPGGMWSTAEDIAKYCMTIQDIYTGKRTDFLSKHTIDLMLTQHSNREWGLGPWVPGPNNSKIFRHDGKNHGYFAEFIAHAESGDAIVVMTNGDRGYNLTREIMLGISDMLDWDVEKVREIDVPNISTTDLEQYTGIYDWIERPGFHIEVRIESNQLLVNASGFPTDYLTAFDTHSFIDLESSVEVIFRSTEENKINGLKWRRFEFSKIE